ncbi:MAG: hypothetical protein JSR39_07680 [Verrucomicrobia bacterium]|nr:hypothetical protein [Verrucomicrobiota bacterium]
MSQSLSQLGRFAILKEYAQINEEPPQKKAPVAVNVTRPRDTLSSYDQEQDPHYSKLPAKRLEQSIRVKNDLINQ